jgi:hypothetical protein
MFDTDCKAARVPACSIHANTSKIFFLAMSCRSPPLPEAGWALQLSRHLKALPDDLSAAEAGLDEASVAFYSEFVRAIEPRLIAHLRSMPAETHEQRVQLAAWLNGRLRDWGLSLRDPESERPAILLTVPQSARTSHAFRLNIRDADGTRWRALSEGLSGLRLMRDPVRRPSGLSSQRRQNDRS